MKNLKFRIPFMLLLLLAFGVLTYCMLTDRLDDVEGNLYGMIRPSIRPTLMGVLIGISNIGSFVAITIAVIFLFALPITRIKYGIPLAINAILAMGLNVILKQIIALERPDIFAITDQAGYGFPNGNAMYNAAFYVLLTLIVFREAKSMKFRMLVLSVSLMVTFSVGISNVYFGVHIAGDVLAGWIMGAVVAYFVDTVWQCVLIEKNP